MKLRARRDRQVASATGRGSHAVPVAARSGVGCWESGVEFVGSAIVYVPRVAAVAEDDGGKEEEKIWTRAG